MPNSSETQADRREAIRQLLQKKPAATQRSLVDALVQRGFVPTQSSVSRDLREIGAIKSAGGYALPVAAATGDDELAQVADLLVDLKSAGPNLLVIRTETGAAQRVAGAVYVSCSGRGGPHFGARNAELQVVRHALGDVPLVGFFAGGEIARHHLYGYTGVLTVFTSQQ